MLIIDIWLLFWSDFWHAFSGHGKKRSTSLWLRGWALLFAFIALVCFPPPTGWILYHYIAKQLTTKPSYGRNVHLHRMEMNLATWFIQATSMWEGPIGPLLKAALSVTMCQPQGLHYLVVVSAFLLYSCLPEEYHSPCGERPLRTRLWNEKEMWNGGGAANQHACVTRARNNPV